MWATIADKPAALAEAQGSFDDSRCISLLKHVLPDHRNSIGTDPPTAMALASSLIVGWMELPSELTPGPHSSAIDIRPQSSAERRRAFHH